MTDKATNLVMAWLANGNDLWEIGRCGVGQALLAAASNMLEQAAAV